MRLACGFLILLAIAASVFAQSKLTIDKLNGKDIQKAVKEVPFSAMVEGMIDDPSLAVYVLVSAPANATSRSFPASVDNKKQDPAGGYRWYAVCQFGEFSGKGMGVSYQVRAVASNPGQIRKNGNLSKSLPTPSVQSNVVTIKRVKK